MLNLIDLQKNYTNEKLYQHIVVKFLSNKKIRIHEITNLSIKSFLNNVQLDDDLLSALSQNQELISLKTLETIFFSQLNAELKTNKGIVYTPEYIVDYMINKTILFDDKINDKKIIDPSCGSGTFLLRSVYKASEIKNINLIHFVENNIFGIDIDQDSVDHTKFLLNLLLVSLGYDKDFIKLNIILADSLESNWMKEFNLSSKFDYIIGNPPYIKIQSLNKDYLSHLSSIYSTMRSGSVNIFYAFIEMAEKMVSSQGAICFILPNNFLKIKSAKHLRAFLYDHNLISCLIDFGCNMIFNPIMTYNCILIMNTKQKDHFHYAFVEETQNIESAMKNISVLDLPQTILQSDSWVFHDERTRMKTQQAEQFDIKLGEFIRTGIATLRDKLYMVQKENNQFIKYYDDQIFTIEAEVVKPIYKVSEISSENEIDDSIQYIIYPYYIENNKAYPISESDFISKYPKTYEYLLYVKNLLSERSADRNMQYWYQYGRSQGINNFGEKLLYSQFLKKPKFIYCSNVNSLFCNGFAISANDKVPLKVLQKILHSSVFELYISKTSYTIAGGFYCYQKKYLSNFSIPDFSNRELEFILKCNDQNKINAFLEEKYYH